jgi:hypothetical protein
MALGGPHRRDDRNNASSQKIGREQQGKGEQPAPRGNQAEQDVKDAARRDCPSVPRQHGLHGVLYRSTISEWWRARRIKSRAAAGRWAHTHDAPLSAIKPKLRV